MESPGRPATSGSRRCSSRCTSRACGRRTDTSSVCGAWYLRLPSRARHSCHHLLMGARTDWSQWHRPYDDTSSPLAARLVVVQREILEWLTLTKGRVRVLSSRAGDARDLLGVLRGRPDSDRVTATLLELDEPERSACRGGSAGGWPKSDRGASCRRRSERLLPRGGARGAGPALWHPRQCQRRGRSPAGQCRAAASPLPRHQSSPSASISSRAHRSRSCRVAGSSASSAEPMRDFTRTSRAHRPASRGRRPGRGWRSGPG